MDWWIDYFKEGWEPIQERYKTAEDTWNESGFIAEYMLENEYKSVLDVPCGSGRISLALAKDRFEVCGLEYNPDAIKKAKEKAKAEKLSIDFIVGDMRDMTFNRSFDMVVCAFNSFGYFSDEDNKRFLQSVSDALQPNGTLLLDCHVLETMLPVFSPKSHWRIADFLIVEDRMYDYTSSRLQGTWTIVKDGKQQSFTSDVRVYSYNELITLLKSVGFTSFEAYGNYYGDAFELGDDGLVLLATKLRVSN